MCGPNNSSAEVKNECRYTATSPISLPGVEKNCTFIFLRTMVINGRDNTLVFYQVIRYYMGKNMTASPFSGTGQVGLSFLCVFCITQHTAYDYF